MQLDQIVDFLKVMVPALVVGSAIFTAAVRALQADPMLQMKLRHSVHGQQQYNGVEGQLLAFFKQL